MAITPQTHAKIGAWFQNYIAGQPTPAPATPGATKSITTTGLLGSDENVNPSPTGVALSPTLKPPVPAPTEAPPVPTGGVEPLPPPTPGPGTGGIEPLPPKKTPAPTGLLASSDVATKSATTPPIPTNSGPEPAAPPVDNPAARGTGPNIPPVIPVATTPAPATPAASTPAPPTAPAPTAPAPATTPTGAPTGLLNNNNGVTTLDPNGLALRTLNPGEETVEGRLNGLLADNSDYIQGFRERSAREANARGLVNSTMAASAGEEAAAAGALPIATADAAAYNKAADYNAAAKNQATMFNADSLNKMSIEDLAAATQRHVAEISASASTYNAAVAANASRYNAEVAANSQRYSTDANERIAANNRAATTRDAADHDARTIAAQQAQQNSVNHTNMINAIMNNNDIPPARRAEMLRAIGENDLANAIYVAGEPNPPGTNADGTTDHDGDPTTGGGR